jgi:hypothetical protein
MNIAPVSSLSSPGPRPLASEIVFTIARIALFHAFEEHEITNLLQAFNLERLRDQLVALGMCEADAGDGEVARLYFSGRCRAVSPNAFFDEAWYSRHYAEVATALKSGGLVSGFVHFMKDGIANGLWPNEILYSSARICTVALPPKDEIEETLYLERNPAVGAFLAAFPSMTPTQHYNAYGRFLGYSVDLPQAVGGEAFSTRVAEAEFDAAFYAAKYLAGPENACYRAKPFDHYLTIGMKAGHSPNSWFQEDFYRAFYKEVRDAIGHGWLPSGFYHYLLSGRIEGRLPRYDLAATLEARMPGVTVPTLNQRADMLRGRLAGMKTLPKRETTERKRRIWLLLPTLNPDIMYGGYRSAIELICALHRDGNDVAVVCLGEDPNTPYFLWSETSARVRAVFSTIDILDAEKFTAARIGRSDLFMAYTVWDLQACAQLAALTDHKKPLLLAQEYEPIFYDNGAQRALCEACYAIPHYPIINTNFLLTYLRSERIGIFQAAASPVAVRDFTVFEHKINRLPLQNAASMKARENRVMAVYARPEAHAARNLFEIVLLALQELCGRGAFGPEWSFVGLGALTKMPPISLGGGHELRLAQKMSEDEYRQTMSAMDIGISLMYAPHPSVVPFEFATTGAMVVTNTYSNRCADMLRDISGNIVPCTTSVESVVDAIELALGKVGKYAQRQRQALVPPTSSWDEIFTPAFLADMIAGATGTLPKPVATRSAKVDGVAARQAPPMRGRGKRLAYQPDSRQGA